LSGSIGENQVPAARRRPVRSGHEGHAAREQGLEQASQDHGVSDVGDGEFVEAQQAGFPGDQVGQGRDGIVTPA